MLGVPGDWLYAVGDITGRALLTHMGKYQARICGAVIAARAQGRPATGSRFTDVADAGKVPQVTFTDPQVASVGVTEKQARDAGLDVETVEYDMAGYAGTSLLRDGYVGRAKLVIDKVNRRPGRRDLRRRGRRRTGARSHSCRRRWRHPRAAVARRAVLPDDERDLAQIAGGPGRSAVTRLVRPRVRTFRP